MATVALRHLSDSISIALLQTALESSTSFSPSAPARTVRNELHRLNYDQAPVLDAGVPVGFVLARELANARGSIAAFVRRTFPDRLASASTTLETALPWLAAEGFLFVLADRTVSGFVVPSDINKQAGRTYFYVALAELELQLADAVRRDCPDQEELLSLLAGNDRSLVRRRIENNRSANVEADIVAELTMPQLFKLAAIRPTLREALNSGVDGDWDNGWNQVCSVRNRVAHASKPMLQRPAEIHQLTTVLAQVREIVQSLDELRP